MNIFNLCQFRYKLIKRETIIVSNAYREKWCQMPYPGNPSGCPNYGKKHCPPNSPSFEQIAKGVSEFMLVWCAFQFNFYQAGMKLIYPTWSDKKIRCLLYWQGQLKAYLREYIRNRLPLIIPFKMTSLLGCGSGHGWNGPSMESAGINVFATLKRNGIIYEIKPETRITMVCLLLGKQEASRQTCLTDIFLSKNKKEEKLHDF